MKPVLVIMAAGMGSRFGGLKQITPVDDAGHILMDYSIFDAMRAGFGRVVLIIKPELEADFTNLILSRLSGEASPVPRDASSPGVPRMPCCAPARRSTRRSA